ncbi:MAG: glucosamine--fructose-6-phosphate aminotransferase [Gammaproteobacteria bacterium]|nr:glucosamine--fructose-6-phosphate aminotransferase [Gammaproteobacteria bacterium]
MTQLIKSLQAWGFENFKKTLKQEMEGLNNDLLPLNKATCQGGVADDSNIAVLVNSIMTTDTHLQINTGIFFYEIIAGCNCNDDPVAENTYCEVLVSINRTNAETEFILLS